MFEITRVRDCHIDELARSLDKDDILECVALGALPDSPSVSDMVDMLTEGIVNSDEVWSLLLGDLTLAIGGIRDDKVWLLTSEKVTSLSGTQRVALAHTLKGHLLKCLNKHGMLRNFVHNANTKHIRLLKALGATFGEDVKAVDGELFHHFTFTKR